jgi:hypothetical protein
LSEKNVHGLVIVGASDPTYPEAEADTMVANLPAPRRVVIEDARDA